MTVTALPGSPNLAALIDEARRRARRRRALQGVLALAVLAFLAGAFLAINHAGGSRPGGHATLPIASRAEGGEQRSSGGLEAFQRPAKAGDAVPQWAIGFLANRFGAVVASRRIAAANGFRGHAALYLVRLKRDFTCLIQVDHGGGGGGCSPSQQFLSSRRRVAPGAGNGFFHGVAGNEIARVGFVDPRGRLHPVRLTPDRGFIYVCRARNGCVDVIKAVNGYDRRGRLVSHQRW